MTSAAIFGGANTLHAQEKVNSATMTPEVFKIEGSTKNNKFRNDGLCNPAITIRPYQLLSIVCIIGGAKCPQMETSKAAEVINRLKKNPTATIRLASNVDEIPHFTSLTPTEHASPDTSGIMNRKRDLDVLQRLGLVPGDTRRARYLFELLFSRIETPNNICAYNTSGWHGCSLAQSGAYEKIHAKGWEAVVYSRSDQERAEYRKRNAKLIAKNDKLFIRPHHLMCLSCWYGNGMNLAPRSNDTIYEILMRIRKDPDIPITLIEGTCMACDCCDGFHPPTVYFPLIVKEAIMIEPTETESKETIDEFVKVMIDARNLAQNNPERLKNAPLNTCIKRPDEVLAARQLNIRYKPEDRVS